MLTTDTDTPVRWIQQNHRYLEAELVRLRLLLQRRVLWLRPQWQQDPLQGYQSVVVSDARADELLRGDGLDDEARFYAEDAGAAALGQAIRMADEQLASCRQDMYESGMPPAMDVLAHLFGLNAFEQFALVLALAPALDPAFGRLFAYVQDDASLRYATPHLAATLYRAGQAEAADTGPFPLHDSFLPDAPLRRYRLVTLGPAPDEVPALLRPVYLDERVTAYLRGVNTLDVRAADVLQPAPPALLAGPHRDLAERIAGGLVGAAGPWPVVNLTGPPEDGHAAVARALCDRLGLHLYRLDPARLPAPGSERREMLHLLERESILSQLAYYLAADPNPPDRDATLTFAEVVERLGAFTVVSSRERWPAQRPVLSVPVPKLEAAGQRALWQEAVGGAHVLNGQVEALVQQFDLGPEAVAQAVAAARRTASLRNEDGALAPEDIWAACRAQTGQRLDALAQRITSPYGWDDLVVPEDVARQLREIAAQVAHRHRVYETWGFGARLNRGRGISVLFAGTSGTGKTMAAEVLANDLALDLYRIDLAGVVSKYIGETEKNLKRIFDTAEQSGAILFFDEADALFGKRTEVKDSHDRYANIEIDYLLQRMEAYRGLAILATNRKADLDRAFLRRLRFLIDFPFPDVQHRRLIWQKAFPPETPIDGLDLDFLARLELPGGNIKNIALSAAFLAAGENSVVRMTHVMHAARREYAKIDKLVTQNEFGPYYERTRG